MIDIWRVIHRNNIQFTWRLKNKINEASRIDYFLVCPEIRSHIYSTDIRPALISHTDHQAISLKVKGRSQSKGKGYFKINNSILDNIEYKNIIKGLIMKYKNKTKLTDNIGHQWDLFKIEVREHTVAYCKRNANKNKSEIHILENKIKKLNENINRNCKDDVIKHFQEELIYNECKLRKIYEIKSKGAQIRSRIKWVEEGEKNTKFFLGLEKARQTRKTITALKDDKGVIHTESSKILQIEKDFYQNIYNSTSPNVKSIDKYINDINIDHKLNKQESEIMEGTLTIEECTNSLFKMKLNKSPGIDGLSVEFYRTFWDDLKEFAVSTFNYSYKKGELTSFQKLGVNSLIHKKNDPLCLNNYRPITLLYIDTKLIAYSLAQRIKNILPNIIHKDQNGYVKNRYIDYMILA